MFIFSLIRVETKRIRKPKNVIIKRNHRSCSFGNNRSELEVLMKNSVSRKFIKLFGFPRMCGNYICLVIEVVSLTYTSYEYSFIIIVVMGL